MGVFSRFVLGVKKALVTACIIVFSVCGVDVPKHLSNPGTGIGYRLVRYIFKNNNAANERLINLLAFPDSGKAIEIGFGVGDTLKYALANTNPKIKFFGFELSESMLKDAQHNIGSSDRVELAQRDCAEKGLPFSDNEIDVVYHANVIYFVPDPVKFLEDTYRVLKPGGKLGMSIAQPAELKHMGPTSPFRNKFTEDQIKTLCSQVGFSTIQVEGFEDAMERMLVIATK